MRVEAVLVLRRQLDRDAGRGEGCELVKHCRDLGLARRREIAIDLRIDHVGAATREMEAAQHHDPRGFGGGVVLCQSDRGNRETDCCGEACDGEAHEFLPGSDIFGTMMRRPPGSDA